MPEYIKPGDKIKAYASIGNTEYQFEVTGSFEKLDDKFPVPFKIILVNLSTVHISSPTSEYISIVLDKKELNI